jgi:ABC-type uncharacterized transport system permease subunit
LTTDFFPACNRELYLDKSPPFVKLQRIRTHHRQEVLLTEYKAAQSSAEHHDRLVWTVASIVWAGSLTLMGIILKRSSDLFDIISSIILCFLGLFLSVFVWTVQSQFRRLKKQKYDRCKQIEIVLGMNHHLLIKWKEGLQTKAFRVIMMLFIVAWLCFLLWFCFLLRYNFCWNLLTHI